MVTESTFRVNVSEGGAYILCLNEYNAGDQVDLYFKPWTEKNVIKPLPAKVVRLDTDIAFADDEYRKALGVAFSEKFLLCPGTR